MTSKLRQLEREKRSRWRDLQEAEQAYQKASREFNREEARVISKRREYSGNLRERR